MNEHSKPDKVNIDKSGANKSALDSINQTYPEGQEIEIRQNKYLNNMIEQDHRFIKKRTRIIRLQVIPWGTPNNKRN